MKLFVIHRFRDKRYAKKKLEQINRKHSLDIKPLFLDKSDSKGWKQESLDKINQAEGVIVFNKGACEESRNAAWEIKKAEIVGKKIVNIDPVGENSASIEELKSMYDLNNEFDKCFEPKNNNFLELYKIMIESSEKLIQRRQNTNRFFITVIATSIAGVGFLIKIDTGIGGLHGILLGTVFLSFIGLLCKSWYDLIDNYGKLNKAKFDVILRLEKSFGAQVYFAEWVALGKGIRAKKYKSFTSTEKNVPKYFFIIIFVTYAIFIGRYLYQLIGP